MGLTFSSDALIQFLGEFGLLLVRLKVIDVNVKATSPAVVYAIGELIVCLAPSFGRRVVK